MFERIYHWILREADRPRALWALGGLSFLEAFILPIPLDAIAAPIMLADRRKIWRVVAITTTFSVLGGIAGYAVGYYLYDELGRHILRLTGHTNTYSDVADALQKRGWLFIIIGGMFVSYEVVTITSGFGGIAFSVFIAASLIARGSRFLIVGLLFYYFGERIKAIFDRYTTLVGWLMIAIVAAGFVVARWLL